MRLVEDSPSVLPVRRKVVRGDAMDLAVPAYLEDLVEDVIRRLSYLLVGYDVDVVKDAHRLLERLDLYWAQAQGVVELDPFSA